MDPRIPPNRAIGPRHAAAGSAASGEAAPQGPEGARTPPAAPASSASPPGRPSALPHARPPGGLQGDDTSPGTAPPKGPDDAPGPSGRAPDAAGTGDAPADPAALRLERTYAMMDREFEERSTRIPQSLPNGFKLMTPRLREAIRQSQEMFPPNVRGAVMDPKEHSVVFHEHPRTGRLVPGGRGVGNEGTVSVPDDVAWPSARVVVHTHPFTGRHSHDHPSMADQLLARELPNVEHIIQAPASGPGKPNKYRIYTGAYPPRFHTLVENPLDLPASPHSPDGESEPPFKPHPFK